jgi:NAD(P)H-hydrate epimerase
MPQIKLRPLSRDEVRAIDARAADEFAMPTVVLMENAGRGAAELLRRAKPTPYRVLILCGPGNNGGDGGVVARHLDAWGINVEVVWLADPKRLRGDAAVQWGILERSGIALSAWPNDPPPDLDARLSNADWVVDGLLGTGLTREVQGPLRLAIEAINRYEGRHEGLVVALDLPSGLDADRGVPLGAAVRAEITVTFVAPKLGFAAPGAREYTGDVRVVDIGVPRKLLEPFRVPA